MDFQQSTHQDQTPTPTPAATIPNPPPPAPHRKNSSKKILGILLGLIVVAAVGYGGYYFGNNRNKAATVTSTVSSNTTAQASSSTHFVAALGFPFDQPKVQITTQLGLPAFLQAVRISSGNNNPGTEQYLTDKLNDEMARFEIGNPANPHENDGGVSDISVLAISKSWLAATSTTDASQFFGFGTNPLQTPAQKAQYVATVKADTASCSKDPKKGFTSSDNIFKICYSAAYPKPQSISPETTAFMPIEGYAEVNSEPIVMVGFISIYDAAPVASSNTLSNLTPSAAQKVQDIVTSLAKSTFKVEARQI